MNKFKMSGRILCMGAINMDLVMFVPELPAPGETIVTDNFSTFPGGKGGNQAVTAAVLGGQVSYFGKLAQDSFSDELVKALSGRGVDTRYILRQPDSTAGIAMISVDSRGQNSIVFNPGANRLLMPDDVSAHDDCFTEGSILLITGEIRPDTVYAAIRQAKKKGMFVIMDPAPVPPLPMPDDIPALVDVVKPNETEASLITGISVKGFDTAEQAAHQLHAMGFAVPVVTLGEQGAVTLIDGTIHRLDPIVVDVVDSTAAGDVFSGALAAALSRGRSLVDALDFATAAAALSTTRQGAQTSIPELSEVNARLAG
jgi:ribokinase